MVGDISFANTSFNSPYGTIKCDWKKLEGSTFVKIEIPVNTSAKVILPIDLNSSVFEENIKIEDNRDVYVVKRSANQLVCKVGWGRYTFAIK